MPPGPAYNWLCVLNSTVEIISHAAQYKAAQVAPKAIGSCIRPRKRRRTDDFADVQGCDVEGLSQDVHGFVKSERSPLSLQRERTTQSVANDLQSVQEKLNLPLSATSLRQQATNSASASSPHSRTERPKNSAVLDALAVPNVDSNSSKQPLDEPEKSTSEVNVELELTQEIDAQKALENSTKSVTSNLNPVQEQRDHHPLHKHGTSDISPPSNTRTPKKSEALDVTPVIDADAFALQKSLDEAAKSNDPDLRLIEAGTQKSVSDTSWASYALN
ncbi:hypothetical protein HYPSUDRAFT_642600 [Hypholoma sublateritium FD-334 SS-4]|uniref:Uncharacterized protein n=1 Tax=Hypholoma sublateritium (strain FD-334 SS-4) TaxID=945553 RepID=A0A0D2PS31_HYPSF|nr:hypothetical protein HYPSUDRAFT_642600 [Hypholoma sublateritium FD-334 SS-4]